MADYQPMSREMLLAKGECCFEARGQHSRCYHCPYCPPVVHLPLTIDPRILEALVSGDIVTIYSDRVSLVPVVVLQNRVTIVYKPYNK